MTSIIFMKWTCGLTSIIKEIKMMMCSFNFLLIVVSVFTRTVSSRLIFESDKDEHFDKRRMSSAYKFCDSPVAKGKVTFPDSIAGRASVINKIEMFSGYVQISNAPDYLFYWFFSSQDQNASAPLVIWTNGKRL